MQLGISQSQHSLSAIHSDTTELNWVELCRCKRSFRRGTAPEQPVEWAHSPNVAKRIFTNFKTESHEFSNYASLWVQVCDEQ